ncbi:tetratricopeptide repeat protein [Nonomuraea sp. NPDC048892]|uniref:tetratricopeptide repeat protein n=1 Tax=Nonomuraea sp. NPDC048892 TaxID=3154624 RepID=UPI0033E586C2
MPTVSAKPTYFTVPGSVEPEVPSVSDRWDLWLLSPYFGLHRPSACSLHTSGVLKAYDDVDRDAPASPLQLHTPRGFRTTIARGAARPDLDHDEPDGLPRDQWTSDWSRLVELYTNAPELSGEQRLRLGVLLSALDLDVAALRALPSPDVASIATDPLAASTAMKRSHALSRARPGPETADADRRVLSLIAHSTALPASMCLTAALTLLVKAARGGAPDLTAVQELRELSARHAGGLERDDTPISLLLRSTYWRAVSYEPFLRGDHARTAHELDLAEELARQGVEDHPGLLLFRQNLHPLLETRSRAAREHGHLDLAVAYATELTELDPYDGKVHYNLGTTHRARGDHEGALTAFRRAVALGLPHASRARVAVAQCLEALGDLPSALAEYVEAVREDPADHRAAGGARRLASRTGRPEILDWHRGWVMAWRRRLALESLQASGRSA